MKDLAIIVPHFNTPKKAIRLLKTISEDSKIQVIIIDDKSNIDISELIQYCSKRRNIVFLNNETDKKGAGVCRNIGIIASQSEWITFADADDFFVENSMKIIKSNLNRNEDILYFIPTSINEKDGKISNRHEYFEKIVKKFIKNYSEDQEMILRSKYIVPWSKLFKSEFLIKNQLYFDEILVANDMMFSVKSGLLAKSIGGIDSIIYCATKDSGTLTTVMSSKTFKMRTEVYIQYNEYLQNRLTRKEYKKLEIYGIGWIYKGWTYNVRFISLIKYILLIKKHKIMLFPLNRNFYYKAKKSILTSHYEKTFINK